MKKIQVISSKENNLQILFCSKGAKQSKAEIDLIAQAKINLNLNILGKRSDQYHELQSIMQTIALHDKLKIVIFPIDKQQKISQININTDNQMLEDNESNLVYLAVQAFLNDFSLIANLKIFIYKKIPIAAGLAGGSSDAAAVLRGMAALFNQTQTRCFFLGKRSSPISQKDLLKVAEKIGADVPFCLLQGTALCKGIGEIIYPLKSFANQALLVYSPNLSVLTKEAFARLNCGLYQAQQTKKEDIVSLSNQILQANLSEFKAHFNNDFSEYLLEKHPELDKVLQAFHRSGAAFVSFTGSGPSIFALYHSYKDRDKALSQLKLLCFPGKLIASYTSDPRY